MDADPSQPEPGDATEINRDLLIGGYRLRSAFLRTPTRYTVRGAPLAWLGDPEPPVILIRSGCALRFYRLLDGQRAILDIATPGDFVGLDHIVRHQSIEEITAATRVSYHVLRAAEVRELIKEPTVNLKVLALLAEMRWRSDRLAVAIGRLDARARICVMLVDFYDRLRHPVTHTTFKLPLTQQEIADHLGLNLMHVNRTLRRLREERVVLVDRGTVVVWDFDRLREFARPLPKHPQLSTAMGDQVPFDLP